MRRTKRKSIPMLVDIQFYDKINKERLRLEKSLGMPLTNTKIMKMIATNGIMKLPKIKKGRKI